MPNIFDGFSSSAAWLDEFLNSQAAEQTQTETFASWEDDVIHAVKAKRYNGLDEALADLRTRTGLTETAMTSMKDTILKKVAFDSEWHNVSGTTSPQLKALASLKAELVDIANKFDAEGQQRLANAIDKALEDLPNV